MDQTVEIIDSKNAWVTTSTRYGHGSGEVAGCGAVSTPDNGDGAKTAQPGAGPANPQSNVARAWSNLCATQDDIATYSAAVAGAPWA